MEQPTNNSRRYHWLIMAAALVIVVAGMRAIADILNLVFIAVLIVFLCLPLLRWLREKGLPDMLSLGLVMLLIVVIGGALVVFLTVSTNQVIDRLPAYESRLEDIQTAVQGQLDNPDIAAIYNNVVESFSFQPFISIAVQSLRLFAESLSNIVLVFFIIFFALLDAFDLSRRLHAAAPEHHPLLTRFETYTKSVQQYMLIRTIFGLIIAALQTILMLVMNVDFAVQWGVLSFIGNFIPNVGFIIGLIPPAAVASLGLGFGPMLILIVLYTLINNVVENWLMPQFMGEQLNLSALMIFLSLIFWVWVLGWLGAILAIPLTLLVKIVLVDAHDNLKWLSAMMSAPSSQARDEATT
ncbi:MAG: AI-2E family transporter [Anaerolineae bacterium]|nr:AI-2E family transporter [Anaerolineae bacterium]